MITQTITPVTHDLGQFEVRRVLPSRQRTMVGPFIFVDEFGPAELEVGAGKATRALTSTTSKPTCNDAMENSTGCTVCHCSIPVHSAFMLIPSNR